MSWTEDFDEAFKKIFEPQPVEQATGVCDHCGQRSWIETDEDGDYSGCCGAKVHKEK